jgi:FtsP/CotA-like multicopper oxidase with cupredoxin domain
LYEGVDKFGRIRPLVGTLTPATGASPGPFTAQALFWENTVTEQPMHGTVETWEIFNTTADTHPIHIHEVLFSVLNRQPIAFKLVPEVCMPIPAPPPFTVTLGGAPVAAVGYETGFKDTVLAPPGMVTRVALDFGNATQGRFVWHCHIIEHEDHEMMRPYDVL